MATTDPKYIIKNIINTYLNTNNITKDDNITPSYDLHLYERGLEDLKYLFYTEDVDVLFLYGEPRAKSFRPIQDVPVHYMMSYPVTVVTVDKHIPPLGALVCTATTMQAKARTAMRAAVEASAQSAVAATPAYTLRIISEDGSNQWGAGINMWVTKYTLEWVSG